MPMTPTGNTQNSAVPNRAPISALATMSPMSTKPPIAVRMPRVMASSRFMYSPVSLDEGAQPLLDRLQRSGVRAAVHQILVKPLRVVQQRHKRVAPAGGGVVRGHLPDHRRTRLADQLVCVVRHRRLIRPQQAVVG